MTIRELAERTGLPIVIDQNGNETIGWSRIVPTTDFPPTIIQVFVMDDDGETE